MKKLYTLTLVLAASLSFAQTPIITGLLDGPCPGGHPKAVEIYASGTVDFSNYSIEKQSNANTTWDSTLSLSTFGIVTNDFVYIIANDTNTAFFDEFANIPASNIFYTSSETAEPININGDDKIRIIDNSMNVIDQFGEQGVDGSETAWEFLDSWARRMDGEGPSGASFNVSEWSFGGPNALDNLGACNAEDPLSTIVPFGQYSATASVKQNSISSLKMFPNPLSGNILNITSDANAPKTVAIYDVLGKQVINTVTTNGTVNVANLKAGVYIVKITEEGKTATRKLVVK